MSEFAKENWLALTSLVIAIIGGVPGVLAAVEQWRRRPKLVVSVANIICGQLLSSRGAPPQTHITLALSVGNDGEWPITPSAFDCELLVNGSWVLLNRQLIPPDADFSTDTQQVTLSNASERDLQRQHSSVSRGQPATGFLMFTTRAFSRDDFLAMDRPQMRITCLDVLGRRHTAEVQTESNRLRTGAEYPHHGVSIKVRDKQ